MNLKEIKEELLRAAALVEDFEKNHLEIDRDAALNKIRQAYEELRFIDVILVDEPTTEPVAPFVPEEDDEPEIEVEFIMPEDDENDEEETEEQTEQTAEETEQVVYVAEEEEAEPEVEVETEVMPEIEPVAEPEPEPIAEPEPIVDNEPEIEIVIEEDFDIDEAFEPELDEPEEPEVATEPEPEVEPTSEPKRVIVEQSLFGDYEPVVKKATPSRRKIMALYEDEPAVAPTPKVESVVEPVAEPAAEPIAEPEPITEPIPAPAAEPVVMPVLEGENKVLGEVITPTTTIADTIAPVVSVAEDRPVDTLRGAINVVDRFMLIRDLFDDDAELYEQTIDELEKMDNLDDCIIYIAENFAWRPSSEGAKLMMDLLQRKLG